MTFSGHTTRSSRARLDRRGSPSRCALDDDVAVGMSSAEVPWRRRPARARRVSVSPVSRRSARPPTSATNSTAAPSGRRRRAGTGRRAPVGPRRRRPSEPDWNTTGQQHDAADAGHPEQRAACLADRQRGERHAAEREAEPDRLDERVRRGRPRPRQRPGGRGPRRGSRVEPAEQRGREHVPGRREEPHPAHARGHPADAEQPGPRAAACRRVGALAERHSNSATPTKASGHQPHGGSDAPRAAPAHEGGRAGGETRHGGGAAGRVRARSGQATQVEVHDDALRASSPAGGRRTAWPCGPASGRRSRWRRARRSRCSVTSTRTGRSASVKMTSSPATSWSMWRNGWLWLVRWPATTTLPTWPGIAVPGQWPGAVVERDQRMPSYIVSVDADLRDLDRPSSMSGSVARGGGGAIGAGHRAAVVVVVRRRRGRRRVVVVAGWSWSARRRGGAGGGRRDGSAAGHGAAAAAAASVGRRQRGASMRRRRRRASSEPIGELQPSGPPDVSVVSLPRARRGGSQRPRRPRWPRRMHAGMPMPR